MLDHFIDSTVHYLHQHPHMGELFAFVVAFLESLPIVGTIIPGSITMTAVGAMIGAGLIPGYLTLAIASIGAYIGDIVGFACGRIFKDKIRHVWPFRKHPKIIDLSEAFIRKHGGKSILIGRFVGAVRSAVPLVAGILHLSWIRFNIAALPTAILWSIVYCLPGIILGAFSMEISPKLLTEYIVIGIAVIVGLWFIFWLIQRFFRNITQFYTRQVDRYWQFLQTHKSSHWIIKLIHNRQHLECHRQLSRCILACLCLIIFVVILYNVDLSSTLPHINQPLFHLAQSLRIYHLDPFFISLSLIGKPSLLALTASIIALLLVVLRQWRAAAHLLIATIITAALVYLIKSTNFSPRPTGFRLSVLTSSFPSGHTTLSVVIYGLIAFFSAQRFTRNRGIIYTCTGIIITLISLSRLYLGAHWFSDVLGGLFLGFTLLLLTVISYQRLPKPYSAISCHRWTWATGVGLIVLAGWTYNNYYGYNISKYNHTPFLKHVDINQQQWWQDPLKFTPMFRKNRFGHLAQPLNIQWAGNLQQIKNTLLKDNWDIITRKNHMQDTVNRLASDLPQYHLPLFELLYHNKRPVLIMFKKTPGKKTIYILRLWNTYINIKPNQPLWIGMLNILAPPQGLITIHHRKLMSFAKLHAIHELLDTQQQWQSKAFDASHIKRPEHIEEAPYWDKKIWLITPKPSSK